MATTHRITVRSDVQLGTIQPLVYGHFIEHLGRCVYEGIWVGENSGIDNVRGIRRDTVDALRAVDAPVVRWPGGCFADDYHWADGIGPLERRPRRLNRWWGPSEDHNHFGTHEFIDFCRQVGAEPYIAVNVGSGSPSEAAAWMEYCNHSGNTFNSNQRAANGSPEPFNVRYWGVGNENWGCGGNMEPEEYAQLYRRFATYLRRPDVELIACGHTSPDWNRRFLAAMKDKWNLIDHLSIHVYFMGGGDDADFSPTEYYNMVLRAGVLEREIVLAREAIEVFVRGAKAIGIVVDEWGTWHPQAKAHSGLEQKNTLRDAIIAAGSLDIFNKYASCVSMANIAQTVNVLQCMAHTDEEQMWLTPTYYVFDLYKGHMGAQSVHVDIDTAMVEAREGDGTRSELPVLSASASLNAAKGTLLLTVTNRHLEEAAEVDIDFTGDIKPRGAVMRTLTARDIRDYNDAVDPHRVKPAHERRLTGNELPHMLAAKSVTAIEYSL